MMSQSQNPHPEELRRVRWLRSEREWIHVLMDRVKNETRHPALVEEDKETLVITRKYAMALVDAIRSIRRTRKQGILTDDQISELFGGTTDPRTIRY